MSSTVSWVVVICVSWNSGKVACRIISQTLLAGRAGMLLSRYRMIAHVCVCVPCAHVLARQLLALA